MFILLALNRYFIDGLQIINLCCFMFMFFCFMYTHRGEHNNTFLLFYCVLLGGFWYKFKCLICCWHKASWLQSVSCKSWMTSKKWNMTQTFNFTCRGGSLVNILTFYQLYNIRDGETLNFTHNFWSKDFESEFLTQSFAHVQMVPVGVNLISKCL